MRGLRSTSTASGIGIDKDCGADVKRVGSWTRYSWVRDKRREAYCASSYAILHDVWAKGALSLLCISWLACHDPDRVKRLTRTHPAR